MKTLPGQVWLLAVSYALMLSGTSVIVLTGGIIGSRLAPSPALGTLPVALGVIGVALMTLPAGILMSRVGRKPAFLFFAALAFASALLASWSLSAHSFGWFCLAVLFLGSSHASVQQYRFAAIEMVSPQLVPRAASAVLIGGIAAALIGPELAVSGQHLLESEFAGSFLCLSGVYVVGACLLALLSNPGRSEVDSVEPGRPFSQIVRQPTVLVAVSSSAVGFAIMSFIMTATPISMHNHFGHSLIATKRVIQSHVAAMYLPSLISGRLIARFGFIRMMWMGLSAFVLCLATSFAGPSFLNFWMALVLLGIGWNFLFVCGTSLLQSAYRPAERFRTQALHDFLAFSAQATAALSSGWFLFHHGWKGLLAMCLPVIAAMGLILLLAGPRALTARAAD